MELNTRHCLPNYPDQSDTKEVTAPLWYQNNGIPGTLFYKATLVEGGLDQADGLIPMGRIGRIFPHCGLHPGLEMLRSHTRFSPLPNQWSRRTNQANYYSLGT